ncbi:MAG: Clp protease N-terminal domain-containing protein, partial [Chlorobiaceae bacterium]
MQFDPNRFTLKAQEALQTATTLAGSRQHQQVEPEHLLFAMFDDNSSIAMQIAQKLEAPAEMLQAALNREIERIPKVTGASATGQYLSQNLARVFDVALKEAESLKDDYISSEHLLIALSEAGVTVSRMLQDAGFNRNAILKVLATIRGTQRVTSQSAEESYNSLKKYSRNLNDQARKGKLDPVIGRDEEIRRVLQIL